MGVIGVDFSKITVERTGNVTGEIKINNNVSVKDIEKIQVPIKKPDQEGLKFGFEFTSTYSPEIGKVIIAGNVVCVEDKKTAEQAVKEWKKERKTDSKVMANVMNAILERCHVESIVFGREVKLPPSIPMPKVKPKEKKE
ncbi:MAG: hypothetical protein PHV16_01925 [Candidatus Nanoarchaeia archaeon]|nr:hypothetical protein [Candidatus Nanoarchaeia archaeon]